MPVYSNFGLARYEDGILSISMIPPTAIGAWDIRFQLTKYFGCLSGLAEMTVTSGYGNGVSGITIANSGQGIMQIQVVGVNTSGLDAGNYAFTVQRYNSGFRTLISKGFLSLDQNTQ